MKLIGVDTVALLIVLLAILAVIQIDAEASGSGSFDGTSSLSNDSASGSHDIGEVSMYSLIMESGKSYMVGLRNTASSTSYCAGVLIAPQFVLTSMTCNVGKYWSFDTHSPLNYEQYASIGTYWLSGTSDGEQIKVVDRIHHPNYNTDTGEYDFLLLKLQTKSKAEPVSLTPAARIFYGFPATVYGWNWTNGGTESTYHQLFKTDMVLMNPTVCRQREVVYSSQLCATMYNNSDACNAMKGSPMVQTKSGKDALIGIVCKRYGCGDRKTPIQFSRISDGRSWIKSVAGV